MSARPNTTPCSRQPSPHSPGRSARHPLGAASISPRPRPARTSPDPRVRGILRAADHQPQRGCSPRPARHTSSPKIIPEMPAQNTQQRHYTAAVGTATGRSLIVVATVDPGPAMVIHPVERGLGQAVARQVAVFDWLCEAAPHDERYSAGRLRRMFKRDWTPPPGFAAAAAREERCLREEDERWVTLAYRRHRRGPEDVAAGT